jgi:hypothetical protein
MFITKDEVRGKILLLWRKPVMNIFLEAVLCDITNCIDQTVRLLRIKLNDPNTSSTLRSSAFWQRAVP